MFNAPLSAQIDQLRYSKALIQQMASQTYAECLSNCNTNPSCASWNWDPTRSPPNCLLYSDVGYNGFMSGFVSGVRGQWSAQPNEPLILDRPGTTSASGQYALWPVLSADSSMSSTVDDNLGNILSNFSKNGGWSNSPSSGKSSGVYGAVSISTTLKPSEAKTLSILFAWHFPHHNWLDLPLDNFYSLLFHNVTDVARSLNVDQGDSGLKTVATDILNLHRVYTNSTLPDYLIDTLINSASHMRSAMYFANGDWRQWEAYDCDDVDSVHNDHQRHLPYMLYFPETEKTKMYGWAKYQQADGMIQEALTVGCLGDTQPYDEHGGRSMGDVTSIFIMETLELYRWTNDMKFLQDMYPHVVAGIKWQLSVSAQLGLPEHLECTYDIPYMSQYPTTTFNSFLHLAVLRATMDLALIMDDSGTFYQCFEAFVTAQKQIETLLWYNDTETTGYFLAYTGGRGEKAIFTDALYGQVLAFTYDLGLLYDKATMLKHLQSEVRLADTPYGLRMLTGREPLTNPQDNSIWMGASQDWSVLNLWLGMDADSALSQAAKGMQVFRSTLNDQWNVHGLYGADEYGIGGKPWITSHYGFHMVLWHLPFAISGQRVDLSQKSLFFSPKVKAPYTLPVLIPKIFASLTASSISAEQSLYTFTLLIGNLSLDVLAVNDVNYPGTVNLVAGQSVHWIG